LALPINGENLSATALATAAVVAIATTAITSAASAIAAASTTAAAGLLAWRGCTELLLGRRGTEFLGGGGTGFLHSGGFGANGWSIVGRLLKPRSIKGTRGGLLPRSGGHGRLKLPLLDIPLLLLEYALLLLLLL